MSYYGLLNGMRGPTKPRNPVQFGSKLKVPVLGLYSGIDAFVKPKVIARMRGEIAKPGSGSKIVMFPNVDHGFNADYRPSYDKVAATYAMKLTRDWLKERGFNT